MAVPEVPGRFYIEKRRDTFHFRGALKRLGLKYDADARLWYAESEAMLAAAMKLLSQEVLPPPPPAPHGQESVQEAEVHAGAEPQCPNCGFVGGEHSKGCEASQELQKNRAEANASASGGSGQGSGNGDSPKPFEVYAAVSAQAGLHAAAQAADKVLAQVLQSSQQGAQQQAQQQQQMQQQVQKVKQELQAQLAAAEARAAALAAEKPPKVVEIKVNERKTVVIEGEFVPDYLPRIVACLQAGKHVRMVGPAGSGKSKLAQLAARALDRRFGFINFSEGADESHLYGFRDITSDGTKYVVPELCYADLYENGGIWLGDEFDRANQNVLVSLNGSLSEPFMLSLPKRMGRTMVPMHVEFGCIVTMNTWGTGPNAAYTSANRLDASSLDRFRYGTIYVDYNRALEASLMPDKVLLNKIWRVRDTVMALGLQRVVSTRFIKDAADCVERLGDSHDMVMKQLTLDWSVTDKQKVGV